MAVPEEFEVHRERLRAIASRILGSHADAEDAVQEAWLRLSRQEVSPDDLPAWLTTVVSRIALDVLRARRPSDALPEIVMQSTPEDDAALADSVGAALLVVLDALSPGERLAFVLHDVFAVPFDEIGRILGRSTDAAKMLASRARGKARRGPVPSRGSDRAVVDAFLLAARSGDFEGLLRVLDPDVRLAVGTGAQEIVVLGATTVAARAQFAAGAAVLGRAVLVDGLPGWVSWQDDGSPFSVMAFTVAADRIVEIAVLNDPVRLAALDLPAPG